MDTSADVGTNALLWVDKYRPKSLADMDYQPELSERLKKIGASKAIPHMLFVGPSGAGKKTRIMALLREIYGPGVEKLKVDVRPFKFKSSEVEVTFLSSNYHIELNPSDV